MATPREEGMSRGTSPGSDSKIPESRGYVPGQRTGGGGSMQTRGEPETPASRGYRPGMTREDETDKASREVLSSEAALPLTNTPAPWKLSGAGSANDAGSRGEGDAKGSYRSGGSEGKEIPGGDSTRTGGPSVMKGMKG